MRRTDDVQVVIEPRAIGLEVAAQVYGQVCAETIRRLQDEEGFPCVRYGTRRLVPVAAADAWLAARAERDTGRVESPSSKAGPVPRWAGRRLGRLAVRSGVPRRDGEVVMLAVSTFDAVGGLILGAIGVRARRQRPVRAVAQRPRPPAEAPDERPDHRPLLPRLHARRRPLAHLPTPLNPPLSSSERNQPMRKLLALPSPSRARRVQRTPYAKVDHVTIAEIGRPASTTPWPGSSRASPCPTARRQHRQADGHGGCGSS